jgi:dihydrofolate synthase/folylpolyglutamate synthase
VLGPLEPEAASVINTVAYDRGAAVIQASADDVAGYALGLLGAHQQINAAIAFHLFEVLNAHGLVIAPRAIAEGLANPDWPGRLDLRRLADGREVLLDAAHNPAGAAALASYLKGAWNAPPPLVFAVMRDKDIPTMLHALLPVVSRLVVTRASNPRSADPAGVVEQARTIAPHLPIAAEPSVSSALAAAWRASPRIVVAGSIFLLGDVLREIQSA